ncbi:serine hydrolase-like protein isoform X2 [Bacillus rossius redtenbacheri]|uniref:serine hydrolase-like protein isoform X2 n=1 Tax=Bacillus rossius redtenbacheri TaxID=93214 RepID=UPI002FDE191E
MQNKVAEFYIRVPWGRIAAKAWNDGSGQPVLVLHGGLDNVNSFDRLVPLLPTSHHFVCIDLPGHGLSSHFPPGLMLDFLDYVSAVVRVADHLRWDRFVVMGHSFGGQLGVMLAALYPWRVDRLVMLDAVAPIINTQSFTERIRSYANRLLKIDKFQASPIYQSKEVLDKFVNQRWDAISAEGAKLLLERGTSKQSDGHAIVIDQRLKMLLYLWTDDVDALVDILRNVRCPQLVTISNYIKSNMALLQEAFNMFRERANFSYVYVDGHHDVHIDSPEVVAPAISKFLMQTQSAL